MQLHMASRKPSTESRSESAQLGLERLLFFSDAVMAISITLLVIDLKLPELPAALAAQQLPASLAALTPRIMGFVISFAVIGLYWSSHHRYFSYIRRYDGTLIILNLVFLFFIVLMPFAASTIGQYGFLPFGTIVYGAAVAATGFSIAAVWGYATRGHRLVDEALEPAEIRHRNLVAFVVPSWFLASLPFALIRPLITQVTWWVAPLLTLLVLRRLEHRGRKGHRPPIPAGRTR